jgi:hypothetical protein
MKILAIYDSDGNIVAAVRTEAGYDGPVPVPGEGHGSGEFDVPASARELDFHEMCTTFRVDTTERRLVDPREQS